MISAQVPELGGTPQRCESPQLRLQCAWQKEQGPECCRDEERMKMGGLPLPVSSPPCTLILLVASLVAGQHSSPGVVGR